MTDLDLCPTCASPDKSTTDFAKRCKDAWHQSAEIISTPVRLVVATDWDAGFQIGPERPPLADIAPGEEYVTECTPQRFIEICEIFVRDFLLVRAMITGSPERNLPFWQARNSNGLRQYGLASRQLVSPGDSIFLRLLNNTDGPLKPKTVALVSQGRFEQELARAHSNSNDPPLATAADWVINDVQVVHRCGFCGKTFDIKAGHTCAEAAISPGGKTFLTAVGAPDTALKAHCPSCGSSAPDLRFGRRPAILVDGAPSSTTWCQDAWHDQPRPEPERHEPRVARNLMEGPGNAVLIRGCSCGAEVMSAEAYAAHVGWEPAAVRAVLNLYGIADDLLDYHDRMKRADVQQQLSRCLSVSWPQIGTRDPRGSYETRGPYKIHGGEVVGPNLRVLLEHVIELLHMRQEGDPQSLPTTSMMGAIGELIALLNGAYDQGRRTARERR